MDTIEKVKALVGNGLMTRSGLARAAGLHANTLRDCTEDDWNPTADTLGKLERFLEASDETPVIVGAEEIIDEARNGRMYILVDDEDRENEGDLIIPAQMATPNAINFMATHGRGLICLSLDRKRVEALGLEPMSRDNRESMQNRLHHLDRGERGCNHWYQRGRSGAHRFRGDQFHARTG